ncbi:MAG: Rne/Rng family ribonuclease [Tateyamaria sp.]|nr:Rne/Rng family ribonuclease [Tateyamaria sp.]
MPKKMLIDATHAEETRVVVVDGNKVEEFDFESENRRQLAGNIYLAKVTRVEPSLQAAFVDYGGNRHGFLAFSEIHPDYYQIPVADREALLAEERAYAEAQKVRDEEEEKVATKPKSSRRRSSSKSKAVAIETDDATASTEIEGMQTIDLDDEFDKANAESPVGTKGETPVEAPVRAEDNAQEATSEDVPSEAEADTVADAGKVSEPDANAVPDGVEDAISASDADVDQATDAAAKDESIESVADEDDEEDIRPVRKPRPRRYKIQEVIKVRQILLVQVVKEERGNKGAALTTYLSLAGRYCVLMPNTARGGGISRKITNAADRKKLKEIANEIDVPQGAGLIVRTAGAQRTKAEIKRDYEYLFRLWEQIRKLTLESIAPAKIYEEGDLIKRSIRDLYNREIDEVFVEGERGYRIAKDFMKMIMPSHAKNVKLYTESLPLFARYQVETYLGGMFNPTVQLKSGGYIVIGITEALVAIDVNSGRSTKEGSIEETALKTNLEAAEEVARQLRLRDLAGLIVIDFIDMDERRNNTAVEKRMKDKLKTDRARIQMGRISGFGLMEMSRQRLRPGMIEATTQPCPACHGTGLIRSDDNLALSILRQVEEEGTRRRSREVLVKCPVGIANFLMNQKREHIAQIETRYGLSVRIEGDPHLVTPDFAIEKFKTATRTVPVASAPVVSVDTSIMDQVDEDEADDVDAVTEDVPSTEDGELKPKRRRRRRRRSRNKSSAGEAGDATMVSGSAEEAQASQTVDASPDAKAQASDAPTSDALTSDTKASEGPELEATTEPVTTNAEEQVVPPKKTPTRTRSRSKPVAKSTSKAAPKVSKKDVSAETNAANVAEPLDDEAPAKPAPKPRAPRKRTAKVKTTAAVAPDADPDDTGPKVAAETPVAAPEPVSVKPITEPKAAVMPEPEPMPEPKPAANVTATIEDPSKPKRRGWWSLGK